MFKKISLAALRNSWKGFEEENIDTTTKIKTVKKEFLSISRTEEKLMRKHGINPFENSVAAKEEYVKIRKAWKKLKKIAKQKKHLASVIIKRNAPKKIKGSKSNKNKK